MTNLIFIVLFEGPIRCVDVSRDGLTVVTGGEDNQVILWKIDM